MMPEILFAVVALVLVLGMIGLALILPMVAIARTRHINELLMRVERLEREVRRLRSAGPAVAAELALPVEAVPTTLSEAPREEIPVVLPAPQQQAPQPSGGIEQWIGGRALGWAAVVLLLFATAFFLQQAFEHGLIGETGRVALGLAAGVGLCFGGYHCHRRGWRAFSQMLTAAGIVLLYLCVYASFGFYHLLPQRHGVWFLVAVVIEAAALAVIYEAPAVALMAVIGGLLTPPLLHSDRDQYQTLFLYLGILNAGVVALGRIRPWPALGSVALLGTQALFWGWNERNYHPEKLDAVLIFQGTLFALHLAHSLIAHLQRRVATIEELCRLPINGFLFAATLYFLLAPEYESWFGTMAIGLATVYAGLACLLQLRRADDPRQLLVLVATSMAFVATAFPLQIDAAWAPVGWAVQALALWWFGLRIARLELRWMATAAFALAAYGMLGESFGVKREPFIPLLNRYGLMALTASAAPIVAAVLARIRRAKVPELGMSLGLLGVVLLWIALSVEARDFFLTLGVSEAESAAVSVVWAMYAAALLAVGFRLGSRPLRWMGLGLFGLTLCKVVLLDTAHQTALYRATVFLVLSLMMAAGAWGYQKLLKHTTQSGKAGGGIP